MKKQTNIKMASPAIENLVGTMSDACIDTEVSSCIYINNNSNTWEKHFEEQMIPICEKYKLKLMYTTSRGGKDYFIINK